MRDDDAAMDNVVGAGGACKRKAGGVGEAEEDAGGEPKAKKKRKTKRGKTRPCAGQRKRNHSKEGKGGGATD